MKSPNAPKLSLLPALALGLVVAWASYAGTETSIEDMSSSIGAGEWDAKACNCESTSTYPDGCDGDCTVTNYSVVLGDESTTWTYEHHWCWEMDNGCDKNHTAAVCQSQKPSNPPYDPF